MVKTLLSNAGGVGSIPGLGAMIPHASGPKKSQNIKQNQYCIKSIKALKNGPHKKKRSLKKKDKVYQINREKLINNGMIFELFNI